MANRKPTLGERPSIFRKTDEAVPEITEQGMVMSQQAQISGEKSRVNEENIVLERTSLYLHPSQSDKLDVIALRHKKRTGKRINRSDIIRRLIDKYDVEEPL
jgi:hypothetical protein